MKKNMSSLDRILRTLAGIAVVILYLTNVITGTPTYVLLGMAVALIGSSAIGFCPIYAPFGFSTCPRKEVSEGPRRGQG